NVSDIAEKKNYFFEKADINDTHRLEALFGKYHFDAVIHLAAESHVDRSISDPSAFVKTNVLGTSNLLNLSTKYWEGGMGDKLFYHVSTDEVDGSLGADGFFTEATSYAPRSPYSASKASSDHLVRAYGHTYGLPIIISNCSNKYGACQFPEKLIPLAIHNINHQKPVPIYGSGDNVRDWLWVYDHAGAIDLVFHQGTQGETYNIGGGNEWTNLDLIQLLCVIMDRKLG